MKKPITAFQLSAIVFVAIGVLAKMGYDNTLPLIGVLLFFGVSFCLYLLIKKITKVTYHAIKGRVSKKDVKQE